MDGYPPNSGLILEASGNLLITTRWVALMVGAQCSGLPLSHRNFPARIGVWMGTPGGAGEGRSQLRGR